MGEGAAQDEPREEITNAALPRAELAPHVAEGAAVLTLEVLGAPHREAEVLTREAALDVGAAGQALGQLQRSVEGSLHVGVVDVAGGVDG